jgi:cardiolipin synthase
MDVTGWPRRSRRRQAVALVGLASVTALLWLVACSSLPKIVPDLARDPSRASVQLEGARGPLSAAQS